MFSLSETKLGDILPDLPDIKKLKVPKDFENKKDDLFICVLGFEDRAKNIAQKLSDNANYQCTESILLEYLTNRKDNEINREATEKSLTSFSDLLTNMQCEADDFLDSFRQILKRLCNNEKHIPSITFDISSCSAKLTLELLHIIFEFNVRLLLVYTEAALYYPLEKQTEEILKLIDEKGDDFYQTFGPTRGVAKIVPSRFHSGCNLDDLPNAAILFATYKPERNTTALSNIFADPPIEKYGDRIVWVIGKPHKKKDYYRIEFTKKINKITRTSKCKILSTFYYKETLSYLNEEFEKLSNEYHVFVTALGSKMQVIGLSLFHHIHPDVTILFVTPKEYDADKYSEGSLETWKIDFGEVNKIKEILDKIGTLELKN
ncbi:hypothetical protein [Methanoregula sp.]|jgi:hypothetical protein|uniref:hypothetical protein n=1 Tax=Methanoregula sp. TaxID=2052170 RepID=UPI003C1CAFBE